MIIIKQPKILNIKDDFSRLSCDIQVDDELRTVWFDVAKEYEEYLCVERADAFVIGLLSWAMRLNHDIKCEVPVTDELLYNIETYVIPSLTKYGKSLHNITIDADIQPALSTAGGVGTGCSCGVDSFHAILNNYNSKYPNAKLTHLCLNNVGSFGSSQDKTLITTRRKVANEIAAKLGLKVVITDSNFADIFVQDHLLTNTYSSIFAVFCLQKLWKTYFYASCHDFSHFKLQYNDLFDTSFTDLLLLNSFSNRNLRLYSEGATKTRLEKTAYIADSSLVQENLHVCLHKSHNCGKCPKCIRTMNSLYALGKLDKFSQVFNVKEYYRNINFYLGELYWLHLKKDTMIAPEYEVLKKKIPLYLKLKLLLVGIFKLIRKTYRDIFKKKEKVILFK